MVRIWNSCCRLLGASRYLLSRSYLKRYWHRFGATYLGSDLCCVLTLEVGPSLMRQVIPQEWDWEDGYETDQAYTWADCSQVTWSRPVGGREHSAYWSDATFRDFASDVSAVAEPIWGDATDDVARLETLDLENAKLKRLFVEKGLGKDMLRMVPVQQMWWKSGDPEWFSVLGRNSRVPQRVFYLEGESLGQGRQQLSLTACLLVVFSP